MKLIIAEKPSLARNIAAAIGKLAQRSGYMEGEGYLVTWAFGHLFGLADIDTYAPNPDGSTRWTMATLPCFPERYIYELRRDENGKPDEGVNRQFHVIESLCNRQDVEALINAGDADREGEIIVRTCISKALHSEKSVFRLWLPDQTPQTIRAALEDLHPDEEYKNLANEGYARTCIDWLYGTNLTRYATLRTGRLLRVGRVIVPIVRAIYDRDLSIRNFKPEKYYAIVSRAETKGETVELTSKTEFRQNQAADAAAFCAAYNALPARVTEVKSKSDTVSPGKLYSLSKLQNVLSKKYKMSMTESLDIIQKLYENGYLSYPRTNSEYLATAEQEKVKTILGNIAKLGYPVQFRFHKSIFDDAKIESHSALTPTYKIPAKSALSEREQQVYSTVFRRFVAVFCAEPCVAKKSEIKIEVGDREVFTLKGTVLLEPGWTKYDDCTVKDKILPPLEEGEQINIDFKPVEKETTPPKHYTVETLNNYLKNPFREEKAAARRDQAERQRTAEEEEPENDEEDYRAVFEGLELGTEATRTGIIDNARKSRYIDLKKDVYTILPEGEFLIEALSRMNICMDKYKTSQMGQALKAVYHGKMTVRGSIALAQREIAAVFETPAGMAPEDDWNDGCIGDEVGPCPLCGGRVRRTRFGYGCDAYRENGCKFTVQGVICGRVISLENMRMLLTGGRTSEIRGFRSKKGKLFSAALVLREGRAVFDFNTAAPESPTATTVNESNL